MRQGISLNNADTTIHRQRFGLCHAGSSKCPKPGKKKYQKMQKNIPNNSNSAAAKKKKSMSYDNNEKYNNNNNNDDTATTLKLIAKMGERRYETNQQ